MGTVEKRNFGKLCSVSKCLKPAGRVLWLRSASLHLPQYQTAIPDKDRVGRKKLGRRLEEDPCTSHALTAAKCIRFPWATPISNLRSKMAPIRLLLTGRRIWRQHLLRGSSRAGQIAPVGMF
jgi:hypothetical protein